jgi:protein-disulfide isomerase
MKYFLLSLVFAFLLSAQEWKTAESLPGLDLSGLTASQKTTALKLLRENGCTCGCSMKLAQCRVEDPKCAYSNSLASVIVKAIQQGKSESEALAAAKASPFGQERQEAPVLENPVAIPTAGSPVTGPNDARVTLVEFSDFQCPYCALATPQLEAILKAYPTQVRLIFKQYPLDTHPQAPMAAAASLAAYRQGKFWQMHDALFANHDKLSRETILASAKELGIDMKRFEADLNSTEIHETVTRDMQDGDNLGVQGTPTLFIDGQRYNGPIEAQALKPLLDTELRHAAPQTQASAAGNK